MKIVAIDPGKKCLGWAIAHDGIITACGAAQPRGVNGRNLGALARNLAMQIPLGPVRTDLVIIEHMMHYPTKGRIDTVQRQDAIANDLIDLAAIGAYCGAQQNALSVVFRTPAEWKGQVPKAVHQRRIWGKLHTWEHKIFGDVKLADHLKHNVMDAIGIALHELGRL